MRLTFDLFLEVNAGLANPEFFEGIAKYDHGQGIDSGAWVRRIKLDTLEIEQDLPEGRLIYAAHCWAEMRADEWAAVVGIPDWKAIGRVRVQSVENQPITYPHGVCESPNPAIRCGKCGGPMLKRKSATGPFWACPDFPKCRGSRSISQ